MSFTRSGRIVLMTATEDTTKELDALADCAERQGFDPVIASYNGSYQSASESTRHTIRFEDLDPNAYDAVVIVGGYGTTAMRSDADVLEFIADLYRNGGVVAAIADGVQVLVSVDMSQRVDLVKGRFMTTVAGIADDLINAGAIFEDMPAAVDGRVVTGRSASEVRDFCTALQAAVNHSIEACLYDEGTVVPIG